MAWLREDVDRACAAVVSGGLGAVALAGSATHVLHVGEYPDVNVTGWMVWTVAGSLEVLAAYAAWEMRRRSGWDRLLPGIVFLLSVGFIILANLAAADALSWAARLPWAQAFAVAPPVSFVSVAAIAETRGWARPKRRSRPVSARATKGSTLEGRTDGRGFRPPVGNASTDSARESSISGTYNSSNEPGVQYRMLIRPLMNPGEERAATIERWVLEGHPWKSMVEAGVDQLEVSDSTMKREIREARGRIGSRGSADQGQVPKDQPTGN